MNNVYRKKDLVAKLTELDIVKTKKDAGKIIDFVFEDIKEQLIEGTPVQLAGFINFKLGTQKAREARTSINPLTKKDMVIAAQPAKRVVRIVPVNSFKIAIAEV